MKKHALVIALLTAVAPVAAFAQTAATPSQTAPAMTSQAPNAATTTTDSTSAPASSQAASAPSHMTVKFIQNAAISGMFEVQSSKLALQKSQNDQVKQFAQQMIDDHTKADHELKDTVSSENIDSSIVLTQLDSKHQSLLNDLKSASASDFDSLYIKDQTKAHKSAVRLFKKYSNKGDDKGLKDFATSTLPTLQSHLDHVKQLKSSQS